MLHSKVYQTSVTTDINDAIIARDAEFFHDEIKRLGAFIHDRDEQFTNGKEYDQVLTRLHLCLAFYDSLTRHGETVKLINDIVNF